MFRLVRLAIGWVIGLGIAWGNALLESCALQRRVVERTIKGMTVVGPQGGIPEQGAKGRGRTSFWPRGRMSNPRTRGMYGNNDGCGRMASGTTIWRHKNEGIVDLVPRDEEW